jgi:class 3 adenylate cyclase
VICLRCGNENDATFQHCVHCGASLAAPAPERRKLATLVFCDLSGSTAMGEHADAETVRGLMLA